MELVIKPDFAIIVHRDPRKPPAVINNVTQVAVEGGRRFDGNGYRPGDLSGKTFSFGYDTPQMVHVFKGTKIARFSDAKLALFGGGFETQVRSPTGISPPMSDLARIVHSMSDVPHDTEIIDPFDGPVNIDDNDASQQIEDYIEAPLDKDEQAVLGAGETTRSTIASPYAQDDLAHRARQMMQASIGPDGRLVDDFDAKWKLAENDVKVLAQAAPFVRVVPPTVGKGILGGTASVKSTDPQPTTVAYWVGDDVDALPVTVTIASVTPIRNQQTTIYRPYANILFGNRGIQSLVTVDIMNGAQFTVGASAVTVSVGLDPNPAGQTASTAVFAGMLSFFSTAYKITTRTVYIDSISSTDPAVTRFGIPAFAKQFTVLADNSGLGYTINLLQGNSALFQLILAAGTTSQLTPIIVPNNTNQMTVQVSSGVGTADIVFIFELSI